MYTEQNRCSFAQFGESKTYFYFYIRLKIRKLFEKLNLKRNEDSASENQYGEINEIGTSNIVR